MGVIETIKDVASLVQKADNIELYQKILEMQVQVMAVLEENHELKICVRGLEEERRTRASLSFRDNMYWQATPDGEVGPYRSRCWDVDGKLVRLQKQVDGAQHCPGCKRTAPGSRPPREGGSGGRQNWVQGW